MKFLHELVHSLLYENSSASESVSLDVCTILQRVSPNLSGM